MHIAYHQIAIIGGGAAGSYCAIHAAARGLDVAVIDQNQDIGAKIRVSGGGRCNVTNLDISPENYLSDNPHFCRSALARHTQWDFLDWFNQAGLHYQEKTLGQLFCVEKSRGVIHALRSQMDSHGVTFYGDAALQRLTVNHDATFHLHTKQGIVQADKIVIACGGPSFAKLGGSDLALRLAKQFNIPNIPFRPALVPLTLSNPAANLSGVSVPVIIRTDGAPSFREQMLFTHRGLSGPAVLQISSFWHKGQDIYVDFLPEQSEPLSAAKAVTPQATIVHILKQHLPKALAEHLAAQLPALPLQQIKKNELAAIEQQLHNWVYHPSGTEGMKKAEVCTGGIDTRALDPRSFAIKTIPNLHVIGEALDVTGWLGGYNFQWAWSSAWCCAQGL